MNSIDALHAGGRQMLRFRKLIVVLYFANLVMAAAVVAPLAMLISGRLGHSLDSDRLFLNFDPSWIMETIYSDTAWPATAVGITLGVAAIVFLLMNTFFAGGALAVFHREDDAFFSACARYFWRFLRLLLISAVFYGLVWALNIGLTSAIDRGRETSMEARPWVMLGWVRIALLWLLLGVVNMIFDYSKIITVKRQKRSALRATILSLGFMRRHIRRTLAVYWMCAGVGALFLLAYHGLSEVLGQASTVAVVVLIAIRQLYMLTRMWVRLWTWSSESHVYNEQDQPVQTFSSTIVAPAPPSLAVAE